MRKDAHGVSVGVVGNARIGRKGRERMREPDKAEFRKGCRGVVAPGSMVRLSTIGSGRLQDGAVCGARAADAWLRLADSETVQPPLFGAS